jgi:hypothetical protein
MATSNDLIQDVYNSFLGKYARGTDAANTVIFFEAAGLSPGLDPGAAGARAAALEFISNEADWLPDLTGTVYRRTMRTISGNYTNLLSSSVPVSESEATVFNAMKASAVEALQNAKLGSQNGPSQFLPAYATPQDWFDATQAANWSNYTYSVTSAPPPAGGQANPTNPPPRRILPPARLPVWRMMSKVADVPVSVAVAPSVPLSSGPALQRFGAERMTMLRTPAATLSLSSMRQQDMVAVRPVPAASVLLNDRIAVDSATLHLQPLVLNNSGDQPILQPQFSMSFAYCIVQLDRHWYSGDLLADNHWYIPGQHAGDYASGQAPAAPAPTATGTTQAAANTGFLSWIPVAFVAIKDVSVKLTGGTLDPAVTNSVTGFGPFSFAPGSSVSGLSNPGIEIIAWICSAQPVLPPQSDPSLVVSSTPASSVSTTADATTQNAAVV